MNLHSYKWTSPRSCQQTVCPRPQLPAEPWHQLPLCISLWNIPLKQRATSAWLLRSESSCHIQCWTPPARHQGIPPQRGQHLWPWEAPPSSRVEDSSKPVATSSQASVPVAMPDDTEQINQTPQGCLCSHYPPAKTPEADTGTLPKKVILLEKEINKAMGCLLMTRSSLDAHQRKQGSDFEMALHQNDTKGTKAVREAKVHCGSTIREAEAHHTTHIREAETHHPTHIREVEANCASIIREAEANCTSIIMEAEACCTTDIGKVESPCAEHPCFIQQLHAEGMQHLEMEAMEEEGRNCLSFLVQCRPAPRSPQGTNGPLQLLTGNISLATLLNIPSQVSTSREESTLVVSHSTTLVAYGPSSGTKQWHHLPNQAVSSPWLGDKVEGTSEEPPTWNKRTRCLLRNPWKGIGEKPLQKIQI